MNLRKLLHVRFVASIENAHSPACNERMANILRGRKPCGEHSGVLVDLLLLVRKQGRVSLAEAREHMQMSGRMFEASLVAIAQQRYGIWRGDTLILAPFCMERHAHAARYVEPQPAGSGIMFTEWLKLRINSREDHKPADECSPGWHYAKKSRGVRVGSLTPGWGPGGVSHTSRSYSSGVSHTRVGSLTPHAIESMQVNHFPSLRSGKVRELLPQPRSSEFDRDRPIIHNEDLPARSTNDQIMATSQPTPGKLEDDLVIVGEAATASQEVAADGKDVEKPKQEPKRQSKAKRAVQLPGQDDAEFCAMWAAHKKFHEKWDENGVAAVDGAFGMAGTGSRLNAWKVWQTLPQTERAAAADKAAVTIEWRAKMGWKPQQVLYYLKDKSWRQLDPLYRKAAPARKGKKATPAPATCTTDFGLDAFRHYLKTGRHALLPGGNDPADFPTWNPAERERFLETVKKAIGIGGDKVLDILARRSTHAHRHVSAALGRGAPPKPAGRTIVAPIKRMHQAPPKRAVMAPDDIQAYCASVGVSAMPDRLAHRPPELPQRH